MIARVNAYVRTGTRFRGGKIMTSDDDDYKCAACDEPCDPCEDCECCGDCCECEYCYECDCLLSDCDCEEDRDGYKTKRSS